MTALGQEKPIASGFNSLIYVHRRTNYIHSASELVLEQVRALRWGAAIEIASLRQAWVDVSTDSWPSVAIQTPMVQPHNRLVDIEKTREVALCYPGIEVPKGTGRSKVASNVSVMR
jgi:hypothetical protein